MSTYSSNLKIELIGTGEQSGVWGTTTNSNFSNVFEQSIVGRVTVSFSNADVTLTATNTVASQDYRNVYLNCTGTNAASRNLIVPTLNKNYIVENNTTGGFSIVVKTSAGTGITIPNGFKCAVYVNGTDVVQNDNYFPVATVGTLTLTSLTAGSITDSGLTSGRVTYAGASGLLTDSANLLYSGTDLTVYGVRVGRGAGAVATNTAVGSGSLFTNSSGSSNASFGYNALYTNGIGAFNSGFGQEALFSNSSGYSNSAFGYYALRLTTGQYNTAVGAEALQANTTASNNTAVGYQAGYLNQTGVSHTVFGYQAGYSNVSGNQNCFFGPFAGNATTGGLNTFVGGESGSLVTSGTKNTILGRYTGNQLLPGTGNTLDIRTSSNNIVLSDGDGNAWFYINSTGVTKAEGVTTNTTANAANVNCDAAGGLRTSTSALKYKTNIRDIASIDINKFRPVVYNSLCDDDDKTKDHFGFIADEVDQQGIKELVSYNGQGEVNGFQYERMTVILTKALQELKAEFDAYKATHP